MCTVSINTPLKLYNVYSKTFTCFLWLHQCSFYTLTFKIQHYIFATANCTFEEVEAADICIFTWQMVEMINLLTKILCKCCLSLVSVIKVSRAKYQKQTCKPLLPPRTLTSANIAAYQLFNPTNLSERTSPLLSTLSSKGKKKNSGHPFCRSCVRGEAKCGPSVRWISVIQRRPRPRKWIKTPRWPRWSSGWYIRNTQGHAHTHSRMEDDWQITHSSANTASLLWASGECLGNRKSQQSPPLIWL